MKISIVTVVRRARSNSPNVEYVGRPSVLGNPFSLKTEDQRDVVCDKYDAWFKRKVRYADPDVMFELRRLYRKARDEGQLELSCYCKPKRCHADTIARFLNSFL